LPAIASALAGGGHTNDKGDTFEAAQIARMCAIRG